MARGRRPSRLATLRRLHNGRPPGIHPAYVMMVPVDIAQDLEARGITYFQVDVTEQGSLVYHALAIGTGGPLHSKT